MAFTFRIIFSGISAFVPDEPFSSPTPPSLMTVLFPNVFHALLPAKTFCDHAELEKRIVPPHYPILQFDTSNLRESRDQVSFFVREQSTDASKERKGVTCVEGQDIAVLPDGRPLGEGRLYLIDGKPADIENPTPEEEQFLRWLKNMTDVLGKPSRVNPRFLGPLTEDDKNDVVTRIRFSTGRLRTADLSKKKFEFLPIGGTPTLGAGERLATRVALEFEAEEKVKLVFRDFGSLDGPSKLILAPSEADPHEDVEIQLANLEPEELLGIPRPLRSIENLIIDPDFAVYYRLVDGLSASSPLPVPHRKLPPGQAESIGGLGKPCSPVVIDGKIG